MNYAFPVFEFTPPGLQVNVLGGGRAASPDAVVKLTLMYYHFRPVYVVGL